MNDDDLLVKLINEFEETCFESVKAVREFKRDPTFPKLDWVRDVETRQGQLFIRIYTMLRDDKIAV